MVSQMWRTSLGPSRSARMNRWPERTWCASRFDSGPSSPLDARMGRPRIARVSSPSTSAELGLPTMLKATTIAARRMQLGRDALDAHNA